MRWFFLLLPWFELFTLIQLGGEIGGFVTLLYVFATFMLGLTVIRLQGKEILSRLQQAESGQVVVGQMLGDELVVGFAGLLLLIPGLFTDTLAVLVLIGPLRRRLVRFFRTPEATERVYQSPSSAESPLEGEFRRLDDD